MKFKQTFEEAFQSNIVVFIINLWFLIYYLFFCSENNIIEYKIVLYFWTVFLLITLFFSKNKNLAIFWLFLGIIVAILVHLFVK